MTRRSVIIRHMIPTLLLLLHNTQDMNSMNYIFRLWPHRFLIPFCSLAELSWAELGPEENEKSAIYTSLDQLDDRDRVESSPMTRTESLARDCLSLSRFCHNHHRPPTTETLILSSSRSKNVRKRYILQRNMDCPSLNLRIDLKVCFEFCSHPAPRNFYCEYAKNNFFR